MLTRRQLVPALAAGAAGLMTILFGVAGAAGGPELLVVHLPGIAFLHRNSPPPQKYLIETMCGGLALVDYNNDGRLDIFFVNGGRLDDPLRLPPRFSRSHPIYWNRLSWPTPDGSSDDFTLSAG